MKDDENRLLRVLLDPRTDIRATRGSAQGKGRVYEGLANPWLVGGACRDALLGADISDYDLFLQVPEDLLTGSAIHKNTACFMYVDYVRESLVPMNQFALVTIILTDLQWAPPYPMSGDFKTPFDTGWEHFRRDCFEFSSCLKSEEDYPEFGGRFMSFVCGSLNLTLQTQHLTNVVRQFSCNMSQIKYDLPYLPDIKGQGYPISQEFLETGGFHIFNLSTQTWGESLVSKIFYFKQNTKAAYISKIMKKYSPLGYVWMYEEEQPDDSCPF